MTRARRGVPGDGAAAPSGPLRIGWGARTAGGGNGSATQSQPESWNLEPPPGNWPRDFCGRELPGGGRAGVRCWARSRGVRSWELLGGPGPEAEPQVDPPSPHPSSVSPPEVRKLSQGQFLGTGPCLLALRRSRPARVRGAGDHAWGLLHTDHSEVELGGPRCEEGTRWDSAGLCHLVSQAAVSPGFVGFGGGVQVGLAERFGAQPQDRPLVQLLQGTLR